MKQLALEIKSLEKIFFSGPVTRVSAQAEDGSLGILPDHAPLVTILAKSPLRYRLPSGNEEETPISGGFLIVNQNKVSVLVRESAIF